LGLVRDAADEPRSPLLLAVWIDLTPADVCYAMRLLICAIGRLKQGPERELAASYRKRAEAAGRPLGWRDIEVIEIRESRAHDAERRRIEESIALANVIPEAAMVVILDQRGENIDSAGLASLLRRWREENCPAGAFIVGGADGLAPSLAQRAKLQLAFGTATWPHQLVRIMLLEQLYRAGTILAGHPYHRA
jgi:23S rRNA (pseudouridine1915-N3)-methyltransferase